MTIHVPMRARFTALTLALSAATLLSSCGPIELNLGTRVFETSGNGNVNNFVIPAGYTKLTITGWGGGGGGGGGHASHAYGNHFGYGGGGGGSGEQSTVTVSIVPAGSTPNWDQVAAGTVLNITVGSGGNGGAGQLNSDVDKGDAHGGTAGGVTNVKYGSVSFLYLNGGNGGGGGQSGAGGGGSIPVGACSQAGFSNSSNTGPGGANGGNACSGGTGGAGALGTSCNAAGSAAASGSLPGAGGGGGGGGRTCGVTGGSHSGGAGGNGANGRVILIWS